MPARTLRTLQIAALLAVTLLARGYGLQNISVWMDDVWSVAAATGHSLDVRLDGMEAQECYNSPPGLAPASYFLQYIAPQPGNNAWRVARDTFGTESHPPLYFVLLHFWLSAWGYTFTAARALSLLGSLLTIIVLFFAAERIIGESAAWMACLLCALAPVQSMLAFQVRGYTLLGLLILTMAWMTFEILERGPTPNRVRLLIWCGIAGMLIHYYAAIYAGLQGLWLVTRRELWPTAVVVGGVWTAVLAMLGYYFMVQPSHFAQPWMSTPWDTGLLLLNGSSAIGDLFVLNPNAMFSFLLPSSAALVTVLKFLLVSLAGVALFAATRALPPQRLLFLLVWFAGPAAIMFTLDILRNSGTVMSPRYQIGSSFALYLLLAAGLTRLPPIPRGVTLAFLLGVMAVGQVALRVLPLGTMSEAYDARRAAAEIRGGWKPGDVVVVLSEYSSGAISMAYYLPPDTPMLPLIYLPRPAPGPVVMPSQPAGITPRLEQNIAGRHHVWVVWVYTDALSLRPLTTWLESRYRVLKRNRYGEVFLSELADVSVP